MIKPNYFVIGAVKAGTTSLCELLAEHPDVFMCEPREPQFFTEYFDRGYDWYRSLFEPAVGYKAVGDGSTTYAETGYYPEALPRLVEYAPDARIIYVTRSPLPRLESYWIELRHRGIRVSPSFGKALRTWPELIDSALYWKQISAYRQHFPDERILVLFLDDFEQDPNGILRRCFSFLGVDPTVEIEEADRPRNVSAEGRHEDGSILGATRYLPGYDWVRDNLVPRVVRRAVKGLFVKPILERPNWDEATRQWVIEQIGDDIRRFLEFYGKPPDFWSFEPTPAKESGALPERARTDS